MNVDQYRRLTQKMLEVTMAAILTETGIAPEQLGNHLTETPEEREMLKLLMDVAGVTEEVARAFFVELGRNAQRLIDEHPEAFVNIRARS